ncbi:PqqD family peptide modification chaperone [Kribbella deserti]|uniref:PqqD family peptide modification chaperone n=1 Tax=Kribbella deserti TaxID=1926257 RepID=A0ABV6QI01_9ACTN
MADTRIGEYRLPPYVYASITADGAMLLDTRRRGTWFTVNPAGARLLHLLRDGKTLDQAVTALAEFYRADRTTLWIDMAGLAAELIRRELLQQSAQESRT